MDLDALPAADLADQVEDQRSPDLVVALLAAGEVEPATLRLGQSRHQAHLKIIMCVQPTMKLSS